MYENRIKIKNTEGIHSLSIIVACFLPEYCKFRNFPVTCFTNFLFLSYLRVLKFKKEQASVFMAFSDCLCVRTLNSQGNTFAWQRIHEFS